MLVHLLGDLVREIAWSSARCQRPASHSSSARCQTTSPRVDLVAPRQRLFSRTSSRIAGRVRFRPAAAGAGRARSAGCQTRAGDPALPRSPRRARADRRDLGRPRLRLPRAAIATATAWDRQPALPPRAPPGHRRAPRGIWPFSSHGPCFGEPGRAPTAYVVAVASASASSHSSTIVGASAPRSRRASKDVGPLDAGRRLGAQLFEHRGSPLHVAGEPVEVRRAEAPPPGQAGIGRRQLGGELRELGRSDGRAARRLPARRRSSSSDATAASGPSAASAHVPGPLLDVGDRPASAR